MKAENIIIENIQHAFHIDKAIDADWISSNPYLFESLDAREAIKYLPLYMIYVLSTFRDDPDSLVYMQLLYTLNEYSKCKNPTLKHLNLWFEISEPQQRAILAFLKHLLHNQPAAIDNDEIQKILQRWNGV